MVEQFGLVSWCAQPDKTAILKPKMTRQLLDLGCSQTKRDAPGVMPAIDRYDGSVEQFDSVVRNAEEDIID